MWKIHKKAVFEIIESDTNNVIAAGLEEGQAQTICDTHNMSLKEMKWGRENNKVVND